ncbi:hypothetical protein EPH_0013960 [Eimeria praecox]|uniref:Uncharacterized protein n=1 Tax=Eimeria praecox TaxID=51316 RepID=U6GXX1_9EIME|nr:hypothetical protein EPH_0013960 [Eimeria praecox]
MSCRKRNGEGTKQRRELRLQNTMVERTDACYEYKGTRVLCAVVPGPNGIPVSPEWGKKVIGGGRPVTIEVTETEEYPQAVGAQLEVEATRDKVEEVRRVEKGICRREAEGKPESDYPTDEIVVRPWGREARELADSNKGAILCNLGTTVVVRIDVTGSHSEALLGTEASKSFISQERVERFQLKAR